MDLYSIVQYIILLLLVFSPICFQLNSTFRYAMKVAAFYFLILMASFLSIFRIMWQPGDPENYLLVQDTLMKLTSWTNIKWEVRGQEFMNDDEVAVGVINHQSSLDMQGCSSMWPKRGVCLIKKSLMYAGTFGIAAKLAGSIMIDRVDKSKARSTMDGCVEQMKNKKTKLFIFPEGTRYHGEDGMMDFKKGAFHVAVQGQFPIIPVVISSYRSFYSKKDWKWLSNGFAIIEIMRPISTKGLTTEDVTKLSEDTRSKMVETWKRITAEAEQKFEEGNF